MKKVIYICDRCGKEIAGYTHQLATLIYASGEEDNFDVEHGADLCEECYEFVDKAITAAMKDDAPTKEPKKSSREPAITDFGKLKALLRAGWKIKDVAVEFRCSEQTVRNTIKRLQDIELGIEEEEV